MKKHNSITLERGKDKPDNVYRFIENWHLVPSSHGNHVYYLFVQALVQWGPQRDYPSKVFSIVMQYSAEIGKNVDVSQPAHIHEQDVLRVEKEFEEFVLKYKKLDQ